MEYISPAGLRIDGRRSNELRDISCEVGINKDTDGSSIFQLGNTKVLATVVGPHDVWQQEHSSSQTGGTVEVTCAMSGFSSGDKRRRYGIDRMSLEAANLVKNAVEGNIMTSLLKKSVIMVHLQVLQQDGGIKAACINAAVLALIDAGIRMNDLLFACSCSWLDAHCLVDVTHLEENGRGPNVLLAIQPNLNKVAIMQTEQQMDVQKLSDMVELAEQGCNTIAKHVRATLLQRTDLLIQQQKL